MKQKMTVGANSGLLPDNEFAFRIPDRPGIIICIPAYNEESLVPVLKSILKCEAVLNTVVCIVFNAAENAPAAHKLCNEKAFQELKNFAQHNADSMGIYAALYQNIPARKSGVGMGRKLAMDKACILQQNTSENNILLCLDADCFVSTNYLTEIKLFFQKNRDLVGASIYFEHPFPDDPRLKRSIMDYELHLRYLKNALQWCGYPWYYHTVGSSMAVRTNTYLANGRMNTRKAGEDFYFLHKLMPLGFGEINAATVYPEARCSNRVPFGTGRSMIELQQMDGELNTYNFQSFCVLQKFFRLVKIHVGLDGWSLENEIQETLVNYFIGESIPEVWEECLRNSRNRENALQRFYKWFSGFQIIHCLHYLRDHGFPDQDVNSAAQKLLHAMKMPPGDILINQFRHLDKAKKTSRSRA